MNKEKENEKENENFYVDLKMKKKKCRAPRFVRAMNPIRMGRSKPEFLGRHRQ